MYMKENGLEKLKVLFELIKYAEQCLKQQLLKKNKNASPSDIQAHISNWYGESSHFSQSDFLRKREK